METEFVKVVTIPFTLAIDILVSMLIMGRGICR